MISKIKIRLRKPDTVGIFHDSRHDVALLMKVFNTLHDKVNELVDENNTLTEEVSKLKGHV